MLDGKTIAITRSKDDASEFITLTEQNNATPIPLPTIELVSKGEKIVDDFLNLVESEHPDYSVFLSSKAVKILFDTAKNIGNFEKLQLAVANTVVMSVGSRPRGLWPSPVSPVRPRRTGRHRGCPCAPYRTSPHRI